LELLGFNIDLNDDIEGSNSFWSWIELERME